MVDLEPATAPIRDAAPAVAEQEAALWPSMLAQSPEAAAMLLVPLAATAATAAARPEPPAVTQAVAAVAAVVVAELCSWDTAA